MSKNARITCEKLFASLAVVFAICSFGASVAFASEGSAASGGEAGQNALATAVTSQLATQAGDPAAPLATQASETAAPLATQASETAASLAPQAAKWRTITTPEQLRVLNLKNEGFGPGYYKIGADFTLGESETGDEIATCALLSGSFVIDFNGHTVQSACEKLSTFIVQGANVTFLDSRASSSKLSVRSYGLGCIEVRKGSVNVRSGNYSCQKFTEAGGSAIFTSGGTLTVNGGAFQGTQTAAGTGGGTTTINGGTFYGGYPWAFLYMGGTVKIVRGTFVGGSGGGGYSFAIGAMVLGQAFDLSSLLASGSTWDSPGQYYYTGTSYVSPYPGYGYNYVGTAAGTVVVCGKQAVSASNAKKTFGDAPFNLKATTNGNGKLSYASSNKRVATVDAAGKVTVKGVGKAKITIKASATSTSRAASKTVTITVAKAANTMKAKALKATVSAKKVAKRAQKTKKLVKVSNAKGAIAFKKKAGAKQLSVNKKTGKVSIKKGTKRGVYRMKLTVTAAGNANYKKAAKTVTVVVKVK